MNQMNQTDLDDRSVKFFIMLVWSPQLLFLLLIVFVLGKANIYKSVAHKVFEGLRFYLPPPDDMIRTKESTRRYLVSKRVFSVIKKGMLGEHDTFFQWNILTFIGILMIFMFIFQLILGFLNFFFNIPIPYSRSFSVTLQMIIFVSNYILYSILVTHVSHGKKSRKNWLLTIGIVTFILCMLIIPSKGAFDWDIFQALETWSSELHTTAEAWFDLQKEYEMDISNIEWLKFGNNDWLKLLYVVILGFLGVALSIFTLEGALLFGKATIHRISGPLMKSWKTSLLKVNMVLPLFVILLYIPKLFRDVLIPNRVNLNIDSDIDFEAFEFLFETLRVFLVLLVFIARTLLFRVYVQDYLSTGQYVLRLVDKKKYTDELYGRVVQVNLATIHMNIIRMAIILETPFLLIFGFSFLAWISPIGNIVYSLSVFSVVVLSGMQLIGGATGALQVYYSKYYMHV